MNPSENKHESSNSSSKVILETFYGRLSVAMDGKSARSVAANCGMSDTVLRKYLNGESTPNVERLVALAKALGVTVEWLATGKEEKQPEQPLESYLKAGIDKDEFSLIPLYDVEAAAGYGAWNSTEHELYKIAFRNDWLRAESLKPQGLAAITARGDSMKPTIETGDTLLIDTSDNYPVEGIYVLKVDAHLVVKRVQRLNAGIIRVKSDNPVYDPIDIDLARFLEPKYQEDYSVIGKVVWSGRRL